MKHKFNRIVIELNNRRNEIIRIKNTALNSEVFGDFFGLFSALVIRKHRF